LYAPFFYFLPKFMTISAQLYMFEPTVQYCPWVSLTLKFSIFILPIKILGNIVKIFKYQHRHNFYVIYTHSTGPYVLTQS